MTVDLPDKDEDPTDEEISGMQTELQAELSVDTQITAAERVMAVRRDNYKAESERIGAYAQLLDCLPEFDDARGRTIGMICGAIQRFALADNGLPMDFGDDTPEFDPDPPESD